MMDDINTLADRVEAATGADRELDGLIFKAIFPDRDWVEFEDGWCARCPDDAVAFDTAPAYSASIDAALTLVPDGWAIEISVDFVGGARAALFPQGNAYYGQVKALAATAALALCVAALRARAGAKP